MQRKARNTLKMSKTSRISVGSSSCSLAFTQKSNSDYFLKTASSLWATTKPPNVDPQHKHQCDKDKIKRYDPPIICTGRVYKWFKWCNCGYIIDVSDGAFYIAYASDIIEDNHGSGQIKCFEKNDEVSCEIVVDKSIKANDGQRLINIKPLRMGA